MVQPEKDRTMNEPIEPGSLDMDMDAGIGFPRSLNRTAARLLRTILCFWLVLSVNFALPRLIPGDPLLLMLGQDAAILSQQDHASLEKEFGLDRSLGRQYLDYWFDLVRGRIGFSFHRHRPVAELVSEHLRTSLFILLPSFLLALVMASVFGTLAGWKAGSATDMGLTTAAMIGHTMPAFLLGMLLLDVFACRLGWFPLSGFFPSLSGTGSWGSRMAGVLRYVALPVATLSLVSAAGLFLVMRNAVARSRTEAYVLYARAMGTAPWRIAFLHVFRNACLPLFTLAGLQLGFVVSGSVLVETVFSINGMGILMYEAAMTRDYPVLQGCFLTLTVVVLTVNLLVDVLAGWIDPRIRTREQRHP
ncbi:MAG: ABC transporter permease [Pseudomonadota bacterium]